MIIDWVYNGRRGNETSTSYQMKAVLDVAKTYNSVQRSTYNNTEAKIRMQCRKMLGWNRLQGVGSVKSEIRSRLYNIIALTERDN